MAASALRPIDWLLLLVGLPNPDGSPPPRVDRVRAQKGLFVVRQELKPSKFYKFAPYHFGPFCSDIYRDAETLAQNGLLVEVPEDGGRYTSYQITPQGQHDAEQLALRLDSDTRDFLVRVRAWAQSLGFNQLLRSIYNKWPETKVNSRFIG